MSERPTAQAYSPELHTLHRYFIWQLEMRTRFDEVLRDVDKRGLRLKRGQNEEIDAFMWLSLWYGLLYVVIEGWQELQLHDQAVNRLLSSRNTDLLRRYRNGVFHFQADYDDERFLQLLSSEQTARWARDLSDALGRAFVRWTDFLVLEAPE